MVDVRRCFDRVERLQVIADRDALPQLLEFRPRQNVPQVRLPDERDLDQLGFFCLEIRQHADFLERRRVEVLRFIHDEKDEPAGAALLDEIAREIAQQVRLAPSLAGVEAEVEHRRFNQLAGIEIRVDEPRHRRALVELAEHGLQKRRLAGTNLAGDDDEPGVAFDSVPQVAQGLFVDPAWIEVIGVGAEQKRPLAQVVKPFIHGGLLSSIAGRISLHARQ